MHLCLALAALIATWQNFAPTAAVTLQTFAPCEDLSPHCPHLCASCSEATKWPEQSNEWYDLDRDDSNSGEGKPSPNKTAAGKPRGKRSHKRNQRGWIPLPSGDKPKWLPSWIPWPYHPKPHGGGHGGQSHSKEHGGHGGHSGGKPEPKPKPNEKCDDLFNGGRQLIEAFCPKSCGRCGKSSNPLAAAKVYIGAQCTVAKSKDEPMIGLAHGRVSSH